MIDLKRFRKEKKLKQFDLAEQLNIDQSRISKYETGKEVTEFMTALILDKFPESESYLIQEHQTSLLQEPQIVYSAPATNNIIHIPQAAEAGFMGGFGDVTMDEETESWHLPGFKGKGYSFIVSGDSMLDTFRSGEIVVTSRDPVKTLDEIINDYVYVIETNENILIKRVAKHSEKGLIWLLSDNEDFEDIEMEFSDIRRLFKARRHITFNLSHKMRYE